MPGENPWIGSIDVTSTTSSENRICPDYPVESECQEYQSQDGKWSNQNADESKVMD